MKWNLHGGLAVVFLIAGVAVLVMLTLVVMGVSRREPPMFVPTPINSRPAGGRLVGPEQVTIDARVADRWRFFSFEQGTIIERPGPADWDLAFRRFQVIANGGSGFAGVGGVLDLGEVAFDEVDTVPVGGYALNTVRSDTLNTAIKDWYRYSYLSHVLSPKSHVYAVRTADGRYAKLQFIGYYCQGAVAGCITFQYVYQGGGGPDVPSQSERLVQEPVPEPFSP